MDRIIKITLAVFIILLAAFIAQGWYSHYVEQKYRSSLASTYTYTCTISTNEELTNVTFIIPVPVTSSGDSQVSEHYSVRRIRGLPAEWTTTLLGSGKGTMIKITTPFLLPSSTKLELEVPVDGPIETRSLLENGILFRPIQNIKPLACPTSSGEVAACYEYASSIFATYDSSPQASVTITTTIIGKNEWYIFSPESNQYSDTVAVTITGAHRRWIPATGELLTGIGSHDAPEIS